MRICLFKRPSGFVRYLDQETNGLVNVPGMQVWGLVFGIPIHNYTDRNGYYRLPWRFVVRRKGSGTINVIDLANIYSCSFIATDDAGKIREDERFEVMGRIDGSDLRGCSLIVM